MEHQPIMRRIDHLIIRVGEPGYSHLMELFTGTLGPHSPWPVTEHPLFRSGGVFAGNVDFELLLVRPGEQPQARIGGVAFELCEWSTDALRARGIRHVAIPYTQQDASGGRERKWLNVFLPYLIGSNAWMRAYFAIARWIPRGIWERLGSGDSADNASAMDLMFNKVYRSGVVLAVKYNPAWRDIDRERRESQARHQERTGGGLGLIGVREVVIGVRDFPAAVEQWTKLLGPPRSDPAVWQVGEGPALRVQPHEQDGILYMLWRVRSLADARAFLARHDLLGKEMSGQIQLRPERLHGLDIRLEQV